MISKIKPEHISAYYYKAVLKRLELSVDNGLPAPQFRFLCFLMMGKVIDKKDFAFAVEQYIKNKFPSYGVPVNKE